LRKLQDSGVISLRKGHVQILDVESLATRAG